MDSKEGGNIGIPLDLIKYLYRWALKELEASKTLLPRDGLNLKVAQSTSVLAAINPEFYSIWNRRRGLLQVGALDAAREYQFTSLLLSKHPSKGRIWDYRNWLLIHYGNSLANLEDRRDELICEMTADRYKCNYPSFQFRRTWILSRKYSFLEV